MKIVYVGNKEVKGDNVAQTGLVWKRGEIHEVADEKKALKLLEHTLIWRDASKPYELLAPLAQVKPDPQPRVDFIPQGGTDVSPFWDPFTVPVPEEVFKKLQAKELIPTFISEADADAFKKWKERSAATKAGIEAKKKAA